MDSTVVKSVPEETRPQEVSIASVLIPYDRDDERAMYFGYRSSGLSVREALHMIERSKPWLSAQRHDPEFVELEKRIPEFRRELAKEYVEIEWYRNFRLILEKDYRVVMRSLGAEKDGDGNVVEMTKADHDYLIKMRSQYNAQQLGILEQIIKGGGDGFNFSRWIAEHPDVVQVSQTNTVQVRR